ncbi:MAG TPA: hypothetical protein PKJ99_13625 [Thermoanaerobaculales bacterium]|nr:hypothetical protein [Thermoanaerobaculales bacterium]HPA80070.1 hypothetical protein [Thermoanaerobaculales bacterium]HQL29894.1 hypothetical protein [Thermoanaerobaculales bacterium]HQN95007.1 hypothetical protein [Thermoanaerobaculales bacterium]HQP42396.1 hypothetical protein [Thermoanaerobaculales bacterium]
MRALAVVAALGLAISCASSASVGTTATFYADSSQLWLAAQAAIREMGGRIVHADRANGTVAGRLDVEGTPIDLSISIWGSPASERTAVDYYDVDVRASLASGAAPDEEWQRRLKYVEGELVERIGAAAAGPVRAMPSEDLVSRI